MNKLRFLVLASLLFLCTALTASVFPVYAVDPTPSVSIDITPVPCDGISGAKPTDVCDMMSQINTKDKCVTTFEEFKKEPLHNHYWIEDPQVTALGKSMDRARQFINWTLTRGAIDEHPVLKELWSFSRNITYFFVLIVAALLGLGLIIGQRAHFELKLKVWPAIFKIGTVLLYITFSAAIVLTLIQLSEIMMKFFIENLGAKDLFNVYYTNGGPDKNYIEYYGCRDLNYRVQEGAQAQTFLSNITNITYYVMGSMILLRKIILWFLLILSPFLGLLIPFVFIRNIGWIWIGVFFQWLCYGPLFALFLGALAKIWKAGIPFVFDFTKIKTADGYVFPTAIRLAYSGPSHKPEMLNNGNYIDTFVEYVITLLMLWVVIVLPWWLLRIFRDYCCEGIAAMKNILLSMYDQMRTGSPPSPKGPLFPGGPFAGSQTLSLQKQVNTQTTVVTKIETLEQIKKSKTEDISRSMNLSANKITDIARFETNKNTRESVKKTLEYLSNPTKAETPSERQKFMNIRSELSNRAIKQDPVARQILSATASSMSGKIFQKAELLQTVQTLVPITKMISHKLNVASEKITAINTSLADTLMQNTPLVSQVASSTKSTPQVVHTILQSYKQKSEVPSTQIVPLIAKETGIEKGVVANIIKQVGTVVRENKEFTSKIAQQEQVSPEEVEKVINAQIPLVSEPEKNIEQTINLPATVSLEDYEEVKKMWISQYEKGEVPVTENLTSREEWLDQDIVYITNVLNKLMSEDETLRQEGLEELGYILPIFMINNMKGEELLVYLKAKLEAAKQVQAQVSKEQEITERLKNQLKADEDLVKVAPRKKEEENSQALQQELELPTAETTGTTEAPQAPEQTPSPQEDNR
ncbi:acyltransferase [Candidatus Roizmanbacteria bacterium]|nr:acyltransferase [Candidatus Roizmanbacteria bacterium]